MDAERCPNCQYVAAPGEAAVEGTCPACQRPYRDQPSPLQSEMTMRNMPAPGEEDTGGNPLKEGILGDYQNRARRDESFASVRSRIDPPLFFAHSELPSDPELPDKEPDIEIPADLVEVIPPKKAAFLAALAPAAAEAIGIGGAEAGAAVGAEAAGVGAGEAAAAAVDTAGLGIDGAAPTASSGALGSIMNGVRNYGGKYLAFTGLHDTMNGVGQALTPQPYQPQGVTEPPSFYSSIHAGLRAASEDDLYPDSHPHGDGRDTSDPEGVDAQEKNDGQKDMDLQVGMGVNDIGGTDQGWGPDSKALKDFSNLFPLLLGYLGPDQNGGNDPFVNSLHDALDAENPGYSDRANDEEGKNLLVAILTGAGLPTDGIQVGQGDENSDPSDPLLEDNEPPHTAGLGDWSEQRKQRKMFQDMGDMSEQARQREEARGGPMCSYCGDHYSGEGPVANTPVSVPWTGGSSPTNPNHVTVMACPNCANAAGQDPQGQTARMMGGENPSSSQVLYHPRWSPEEIDAGRPFSPSERNPLLGKVGLNQPNLTPDKLMGPDMKPMNTTEAPFLLPAQGRCMVCGATLAPSDPTCPQCGSPNSQTRNANTMGPATDEQKAAVAEYLQAAGRGDEVPGMITQPWEYADELAQIAQREDPPQPPDQTEQPQPEPAVAPGPEAEMAGPMPAQAPMMASMNRALNKAASRLSFTVDGLTDPCPECGSHSTGIIDEDGSAGCKTCGHEFKSEGKPVTDPKLKDGSVHFAEGLGNEINAPAADQLEQFNPENQQDSSLTWQDQDSNPLMPGQTYRLFTGNYDIPDIVTVQKVTPDEVHFVIKSEFGLDAPTSVSFEDAQIEQYRWEPMKDVVGDQDQEGAPNFEENPDDRQPGRPEPGQETDLSVPHELLSHKQSEYYDYDQDDPYDEELMRNQMFADPGGNSALRAEGPNNPRNLPCPSCGRENMLTPEDQAHGYQCDYCADAAEGLRPQASTKETGPAWLAQEITKEGGAKFTPMEQRTFIDEEGTARNAELLNLQGTHYEMDDDLDSAFLW